MNIGSRSKVIVRTSPRGSLDESHVRRINGEMYLFARRTWIATGVVQIWAIRVLDRRCHKFTGKKRGS